MVAGASISDTVQARPTIALVVEAREGGRAAKGVLVRFETLPAEDTTRRNEWSVLTSPVGKNYFSASTSDTTDASGRASVLLQFGTIAGEARLLMTSPEVGLTDTARFIVLPGRATRIVMTAAGKDVEFGGSYDIGAAAADRFNNRRTDAMTYLSGSALAAVDAAGKVQAGQQIGKGFIVVRTGTIADTARFTVIPRVKLVFMYVGASDVWIADGAADGSSLRPRTKSESPGYPSPSPASESIAFQRPTGAAAQLFVVDGAGAEKNLLQGASFLTAFYPRYSADGAYVYFAARDSAGYGIWRVRSDGSSLTRVVETGSNLSAPGISPDGSRIAYTDSDTLRLLDVGTRAKTSIGPWADFPVFSPDGQRLAYFSSAGLVVANSDGSSAQPLNIPRIIKSDAGLDWLPDSKWLITRDWYTPILVNVTTREVVQLRSDYYQIAVKR